MQKPKEVFKRKDEITQLQFQQTVRELVGAWRNKEVLVFSRLVNQLEKRYKKTVRLEILLAVSSRLGKENNAPLLEDFTPGSRVMVTKEISNELALLAQPGQQGRVVRTSEPYVVFKIDGQDRDIWTLPTKLLLKDEW